VKTQIQNPKSKIQNPLRLCAFAGEKLVCFVVGADQPGRISRKAAKTQRK
jgi:hypothetical protein